MIIPDFLKKGDKIAIVATARKVSPEEIKPSVDLYRSWGLEVITDETLYAADNQFAGNDALRTAFAGESAAFAQMTNDFLYPALRKPRQFLHFAYGY